jgi:hypothetical protein
MAVNQETLEKLGRFLLRGLRIGASTVAVVELLRNDWTGGLSAGVAWMVFLQVERRLRSVPQLAVACCYRHRSFGTTPPRGNRQLGLHDHCSSGRPHLS